jgi:hypothetical protein
VLTGEVDARRTPPGKLAGMELAVALLLILIGLAGPLATIQWREGHWLTSGRWIMETFSPHAVNGVPMAGVFFILLGFAFLWQPAVLLALLAGVGFVAVLAASVRGGSMARLPKPLRSGAPTSPERPADATEETSRRAV